MRRTDLGMPSSEADNESLPPIEAFVFHTRRRASRSNNNQPRWKKSFGLPATRKDELEKLNCESRHFQSLSEIRGRLCNNCHCCGHTKVKCSKAPCTDINACKIQEKHPEHKAKISQLQREIIIRSLENKAQEEEAHLKGFTAARERAKSSFFYVMRPRLKKQNQVKYSNRSRLDRDLIILQRAIKKVPDWSEGEDWRLPLIMTVRELEFKHLFERMNYYSKHSMTFFIFCVAFFIFPFHFYKSNSCRM